jgi:hypothetical protein
MYSGTMALEIVLATEWALAATMRAHVLFYSLWVVSIHVCLQIEGTGKG